MAESANILTDLIRRQAARYPTDRAALACAPSRNLSTPAESLTWQELARKVDLVAVGLEVLGIQARNMVAVFASNCPEIIIMDFACYRNRAVPVSIYSTSSPEQVSYIIRDSGARLIVVGDQQQYDTVRSIALECPELYRIVGISPRIVQEQDDHMTISIEELYEMGRHATALNRQAVDRRTAEATPQDIATLIYTSGTTGEPKGAILPHSAFNAAMRFHKERLSYLSDEDTSVCFLPLSHIFEKAWTYFCLMTGALITINRDPAEIQDTLKLVRPTMMCSVPRFWEKVYAAVQSKLGRVGGFQKWLMKQAMRNGRCRNLDYKRLGKKVPFYIEWPYKFFFNQIFGPMQRVAGIDRGRIFPTAGAPLSPEITAFLLSCGIPIVIGYGLSETTATVTCFPTVNYIIGTVGTVLKGVGVKISPEGEILVSGPTVMRGYYGRPSDSAQAFTPDGWFKTGDAGYFDENGALVLTDRIKDLFKTSNGKYIAPQAIESRLLSDPAFEQVAIIGDQRKFVSALIVPNKDLLREFAREKGIPDKNYDALLTNPLVMQWFEDKIRVLSHGLAHHEVIKRFTLLPKPFTIESGELTNTLKVRRRTVAEHYAPLIEQMYQ